MLVRKFGYIIIIVPTDFINYLSNFNRCLQRNLGREKVFDITASDDWGCLVCDPKQIYEHKAKYYSLYHLNKIPGFRKVQEKGKRYALTKRKSDLLSRKAEQILQSSQNFIEENIGM